MDNHLKYLHFLTQDERPHVYDVFTLEMLGDLILPFQAAKDKEYQSHWARRGLLGYKDGCILRQIDRVEPGIWHMLENLKFDDVGEVVEYDGLTLTVASLMDTLLDTAVYALLGICMLAAKFPSAGESFRAKLFHRVITGMDMAHTDLDLYPQEQTAEKAAELAALYRKVSKS